MDAVGLIKTGSPIDVTVELSPAIASAVTARCWHRDQRVSHRQDGSALIVLPTRDAGEIVRWGFGSEARVVHPPEVAGFAEMSAEELVARYRSSTEQLQSSSKSA